MSSLLTALRGLLIKSHPEPTPVFGVKRVAIIGAGPCGTAVAKYLRTQNAFTTIDIYERQSASACGGVWYYTPETAPAPYLPQTSPRTAPNDLVSGSAPPLYASAMYDDLHANIMGSLMQYTGCPFPASAKLFPSREIIYQYVLDYAAEVMDLVKFSHNVVRVDLASSSGRDQWTVHAEDGTIGGSMTTATYDAVVVANGHYSLSLVPEITGLAAFAVAHPGIISHSKQYRSNASFSGKKVIVVGNGPSGADIGRQICQVAASPLYLSVRHATAPDRLEHIGAVEVPEITEFLPDIRGVRLADGVEIPDVDAVVFCSGYMFSLPFLPELEDKLITTGRAVQGLYQHLFSIEHPTLAFPGLLQQAIPYAISEAQAAVLATVWSNAEKLPTKTEMQAWHDALVEERGENLHNMPKGTDGLYINTMHDWVGRSSAKKPPFWGEYQMWQRKLFIEAKLRFEKGGCTAMTLEDLGFKFPDLPEDSTTTSVAKG
ncbi:Thiol-specific monooxygenase [Ceratocystis fimbriata CBS 114723]|uniref:Thiol-specific monooxygenase n=1 Tax=Ceratocystis fimbriata CBS 114723 TaxID=1035309 RepID=A0A2C5X7X9_9PEZI|nr:Thiol-specific monooxygenase [Ceratocystis fimbriata CBS 114723]